MRIYDLPDGDYKIKSTALNASGGFAIIQVTGGYEAQSSTRARKIIQISKKGPKATSRQHEIRRKDAS